MSIRKRPSVVISLLVPLALLCGCAGDKGGTDSPSAGQAGSPSPGELDAVKLLAGARPAEILGEPVDEPVSNLDMKGGAKAVSQATAWTASQEKNISLQIRYAGDETVTRSRTEFARMQLPANPSDESRAVADEAAAAVEAGRDIAGLGDVAFAYEYAGLTNLVVFWDRHYQMMVMVAGIADQADAVERAKTVARRVLDQLKG